MNLRSKKIVLPLQVFLGAFMIMSGVSGLLMDLSSEEVAAMMTPEMLANTQTLWNMGIFQMIKVTELIAGLLLVTNIFPALGIIFLCPIAVGILVVNAMTAPEYAFMGVLMGILMIYFGYAYWENYRGIFQKKK